jgi:isoquinoline 1-oxidoreductase alpha subunit
MATLNINGKQHQIDLSDDTPLLWALRDHLGLSGTKFGCGMAMCGACTAHLDGQPVRSCVTPVSAAVGQRCRRSPPGRLGDGRRARKINKHWIRKQVQALGPALMSSGAAITPVNVCAVQVAL